MSRIDQLACARTRRLSHERLDGDRLSPEDVAFVEGHVAGCEACRSVVTDLAEIQRALRGVAVPTLDGAALDEVWRRTSRARTPGGTATRRVWQVAAAAAVLAVALVVLPWRPAPPREAETAEMRRAAEEARFVLAVAGKALRRAERAATEDVLTESVGGALDRTSIRWSGATRRQPARGGDGV